MKTLITSLFLLLTFYSTSAQDLDFVHSYGPTEDGDSNDQVHFSRFEEDYDRMLIGGQYSEENNLVIGSNSTDLISENPEELQGFLAVYSTANELLYQYNIGAIVTSAIMVSDSTFLAVGRYSGIYDFDPRPTDTLMIESTLPNSTDAFAGLYHLNGTPQWVAFFNSSNNVQISDPLTSDDSIIIGGNFSSEEFTINLPNETIEIQNPEEDLNTYIVSLNIGGDLDWHRIIDMENSNCAIRSMDKVSEDLILTLQVGAGELNASLSAEPVVIPFSGGFNSFVGSYASQTNLSNFSTLKTSEASPFIWPRHTGSREAFGRITANNGRGSDIAYTSSSEEGTIDVSAPNEMDFFYFNAIDLNGYIKWGKYLPYSDIMNVLDIELDWYGYSYVVGYYQDQILHEGDLLFEENSSPLNNGFIMKLDPLGNLVWAHNISSQQGELEVRSVSVNEEQEILISGYYTGNHDFDFSANTQYVGNFEEENGFLARYTQEPHEAQIFLNVPVLHTEIEEGGANSLVYVSINREISENVIVEATPDEQIDLGNGAGQPVELTFTPDGEKIMSLEVVAFDDLDVEGDHLGTITFSSSGETNFASLEDQTLTFDIIDNDPDAVEEQTAHSQISVYPNPATDEIEIDYPENLPGKTIDLIRIINVNGRSVFEIKDHPKDQPVSVENISNGSYLVQVDTGNNEFTTKLLLQ